MIDRVPVPGKKRQEKGFDETKAKGGTAAQRRIALRNLILRDASASWLDQTLDDPTNGIMNHERVDSKPIRPAKH